LFALFDKRPPSLALVDEAKELLERAEEEL
jgi:hypothetical protein